MYGLLHGAEYVRGGVGTLHHAEIGRAHFNTGDKGRNSCLLGELIRRESPPGHIAGCKVVGVLHDERIDGILNGRQAADINDAARGQWGRGIGRKAYGRVVGSTRPCGAGALSKSTLLIREYSPL